MIVQVQDILKDAMGLIGTIEIDETPSSSEMGLALRTANVMLGRWAAQRLLMRSTTPLSFPTVSGKSTYTIAASGADITGSKPIGISSAYVLESGSTNDNLGLISIELYNSLEDKDISTGKPYYLAYDPGNTQQAISTGTFYLYAIPDKVYTIKCEIDGYLTEFVNLTDTITFEPIYYEALIYNLAIRLFRYFHGNKAQIPQDVVAIASNAIENLKNINSVTPIAFIDYPGKKNNYNIMSDSWS